MSRTALAWTATVFLTLAAVGCARAPTPGPIVPSQSSETPMVAVYVAPPTGGQLTDADLRAHPEVRVVRSQADLESEAVTRTAVWIDKAAVQAVDKTWLRARADERFPVALIGIGDALYSFRETLKIGGIKGPYVDWVREPPGPGFSVWMLKSRTAEGASAYMKGFTSTPTVDVVSAVTSPLLNGDLR